MSIVLCQVTRIVSVLFQIKTIHSIFTVVVLMSVVEKSFQFTNSVDVDCDPCLYTLCAIRNIRSCDTPAGSWRMSVPTAGLGRYTLTDRWGCTSTWLMNICITTIMAVNRRKQKTDHWPDIYMIWCVSSQLAINNWWIFHLFYWRAYFGCR